MSAGLANASRLKPEIRLSQAISEFVADLSNERKSAFQSQLQRSPPDPRDVMRLTAEIDRCASGKSSGQRCFGPRFINVLQAVQQFTTVGDVLIGGSQNMIACGVWSVVRMTMLLITGSSLYLERLSHLFMILGRSAPRYQQIALLYPRSKTLQSSLCEYFIVVVRLCHELSKFSRKSSVGQMLFSLSDSTLKTYQSELEIWANAVKEEANHLLAQTVEDEARENSRSRAYLSKSSEIVKHRMKLKAKLRLLDLCSKYNYEATWKQTRKIGNVNLFKTITAYRNWVDHQDSCTLVYTGKLGSGKSVLMSNMVAHLNLDLQDKNVVVAYFFCRHDMHESLKARTIIGCLARQLLCSIPDLSKLTGSLDNTSLDYDLDGILICLKRALPPRYKAYFILDGLDECDSLERALVIEVLLKLQETMTLHLCVSTRTEFDNASARLVDQFTSAKGISIPDDNPEIKTFIDAKLANYIQSGKLAIGHESLVLEIRKALMDGAQGMFLWVALQIESLCVEKTDEAIRQALTDLPKDLPEMFNRILRRSKCSAAPYQKRILELLAVARRPLTLEELREALSVLPGDTTWNPKRLVNDMYSTLACCGSLITVDEEELTTRFVHHSVKQFLTNGPEDSDGIPFTADHAHRSMAEIIVTYLNYGVFTTQVSTAVVPQIMIGSTPSNIIRSTLGSRNIVRDLALRLLRSRDQPDYDISEALARARRKFEICSKDDFAFYPYAKSYWVDHVGSITKPHPTLYNLLLKLVEGDVIDVNSKDESGWTIIFHAVRCGHPMTVKMFCDTGKVCFDYLDHRDLTTLFRMALDSGFGSVVESVIAAGKIDLDTTDLHQLFKLIETSKIQGITKFIIGGLDRDSFQLHCLASGDISRLFQLAMDSEDEVSMRLLLQTNKCNTDYMNLQDLSMIISKLDCFKEDEAFAALIQRSFRSALMLGHEANLKLCLNTGMIDINSKALFGQTPLSLAIELGNEAAVKLILATGQVDLRSSAPERLFAAIEGGQEDIVKLLLQTGDVGFNIVNGYGSTPIQMAAQGGHVGIVEFLLNPGKVDINLRDTRGLTPLQIAKEEGHEKICELLREAETLTWLKVRASIDNSFGSVGLAATVKSKGIT